MGGGRRGGNKTIHKADKAGGARNQNKSGNDSVIVQGLITHCLSLIKTTSIFGHIACPQDRFTRTHTQYKSWYLSLYSGILHSESVILLGLCLVLQFFIHPFFSVVAYLVFWNFAFKVCNTAWIMPFFVGFFTPFTQCFLNEIFN